MTTDGKICNLSGFGDEIAPDMETQIQVMTALGLRYIELRGVNGKGIIDHTEQEMAQVKATLDKASFRVSAIGSPIGKVDIQSPFQEELKRFHRAMKAAECFETPYIRVFSYYIPEGEDPWNFEDEVLRRMAVKAKMAGEKGRILLHENESRIFGESPDRCLRILEGVHSPSLRGIFDPSNFLHKGHETYPDAWNLLKDHIVYFHIKDCDKKAKMTVPAGEGDAGFVEILRDATQRGFEGFLSLEPHLGSERFQDMSKADRFQRAVEAIRKVAGQAGMPLS